MEFALREIAGMEDLAELPKFVHAESDLTHQILEEANNQGTDFIATQRSNANPKTNKFEQTVIWGMHL